MTNPTLRGVPDTGSAEVDAFGVEHLSKRFGSTTVLTDINLHLPSESIIGLLGRNGAGKTTLMQILTGHRLPSSGSVQVLGANPYENSAVLSQICFVREAQKYPDNYQVVHALQAAALCYPNWDQDYALQLVTEFSLPLKRRIKKLSRGMLSMVGIIVGLASRAPITLFDEPYLGLDAVARQQFYDMLLADYAEHPRTVLLSTHLIAEIGDLLEHVVVIDSGEILLDSDAEQLRARAVTISGAEAALTAFLDGRVPLRIDRMGAFARAVVDGLGADDLGRARARGLDPQPVPLQDLVVALTRGAGRTDTALLEETRPTMEVAR